MSIKTQNGLGWKVSLKILNGLNTIIAKYNKL